MAATSDGLFAQRPPSARRYSATKCGSKYVGEDEDGSYQCRLLVARRLEAWRQAFGDRAYLAVVRTGRAGEGQFVHDAAALAAATGVPLVATNDVRFLAAEDFEAHETRVCIQQGRVLNDPRRERPHSDQQYLRSPAEMRALFADLPEALDNSVEWPSAAATRCSLAPTTCVSRAVRPNAGGRAAPAGGGGARGASGAGRRGPGVPAERYGERLAYELGVITQMGFAGYFLIVQERLLNPERSASRWGSAGGRQAPAARRRTHLRPL